MKIPSFLMGILSCLCPCSQNAATENPITINVPAEELCKIKIGDHVRNENLQLTSEPFGYHVHSSHGGTYIYKNGENFIIATSTKGNALTCVVEGIVVLSSKREILYSEGIKLISGNYRSFLNMTLKEIKEKHGEPHIDFGSGVCVPAYISSEGKIIVLCRDGGFPDDEKVVKVVSFWDIYISYFCPICMELR